MSLRQVTSNEDQRDLFVDFVEYTIKTLDNYNRATDKKIRLNVNKIVDDNAVETGIFPVICVTCIGHSEEPISLGGQSRKFKITLRGNIWYYHEKLATVQKHKEIMLALGTITAILRGNRTLSGFAHDLNILGSLLRPNIVKDVLISGGLVIFEAEKIIRQDMV